MNLTNYFTDNKWSQFITNLYYNKIVHIILKIIASQALWTTKFADSEKTQIKHTYHLKCGSKVKPSNLNTLYNSMDM